MSYYVQGFVLAVPTANKDAFIRHAKEAAGIFKEYGVLKCVECWGDNVPDGVVTSFPMAVKAEADETVVFSWYIWPSKEALEAAMPKIMEDPRLQPDVNPMPFDGKRLIYAGFVPVVDE